MTELPKHWALPLRVGWSVIPLRPRDKVPALPSWKAYQTRHASPDDVERWAVSDCNVGIVTGGISGLLVLDLDSAEAVVEAESRGLPDSVIASTAKGQHHYFSHPGGEVKNRAGILPGMDIRADGGFVVGPGSIHPSGVRYEWISSPANTSLASPPAWLIALLSAPPPQKPQQRPLAPIPARQSPFTGDGTAYGLAALRRESDAICRAYNGEQELALNNGALRIGALVAGGELTLATARVNLVCAGMCMANYDPRNLWTLDNVVSKVDRALADGANTPRSAPVRDPMVAVHA